jgi:hypothetical protein
MADNNPPASSAGKDSGSAIHADVAPTSLPSPSDNQRGRSQGGRGGRGRGQSRGNRKGFGANDRGGRNKRNDVGRAEYKYVSINLRRLLRLTKPAGKM